MLEIAVSILGIFFGIVLVFAMRNIKNIPKKDISLPFRENEPIKKIEDGAPLHTDTSLADKVDGRITNIFKNPWEDIL